MFTADDQDMKINRQDLCDTGRVKLIVPQYPQEEDLASTASLRVWKEVAEAIVANDMAQADAKKILIEESQRAKRRCGELCEPKHFRHVPEASYLPWEPRDFNWIKGSDIRGVVPSGAI